MSERYADVHCHIQFDQYKEDEQELIGRMKAEGVLGIVVGVDYPSSEKALQAAENHAHLFASVGLHPNREAEGFDDAAYEALAKNPRVVAIGECGLDYFRPVDVTQQVKEKQRALLQKHIALATELDKPLIIHARPSKGTQDAYQDLITLLAQAKKNHPNLRGDIHFFVGGIEEAQALIALDFTLSFTGVITFARDYDAVIRHLPLASILSETDAPYVAPASRRGQRNDPLAVIEVAAKIADIRGEERGVVEQALLENAKRLFNLT
jgi:TatD DNase family protein